MQYFFTVISLLLLIQEGLSSVISDSMCTMYWLTVRQVCPGKSVVRLTDRLDLTVDVD